MSLFLNKLNFKCYEKPRIIKMIEHRNCLHFLRTQITFTCIFCFTNCIYHCVIQLFGCIRVK